MKISGQCNQEVCISSPIFTHTTQSQEDKPESTCGSSIDYHACIGSYNQLPFWNSIDGEISIFCNSILGYCLGAEL